MVIAMDPGGVSAAGEDLHKIAGDADTRTKSLFASSDAAAQGNQGWASGPALTGCKTAWQDQLGKLIQKTVAAGDALKDSAGNVASTDQDAENRLDHVMHDWSGK